MGKKSVKTKKLSVPTKSRRLIMKRIWNSRKHDLNDAKNLDNEINLSVEDKRVENLNPKVKRILNVDHLSNEELLIEEDCSNPLNENEIQLHGRRIIDISYFFDKIQSISHPGFDCTFKNLTFIKEKRIGFQSIILMKCKVCGVVESISTEKPNLQCNINKLSVLGAMSIGVGYCQMNEFFSSIDLPCMSNSTFCKYFQDVSKHIQEISWNSFKEAADEEARIAKDEDCVDENGTPIITVIVDGAWSKRSYRKNYNSLSGVACVIGAKTKKIIFLGVRNKYCVICAKYEFMKEDPHQHICYKNWNQNSTLMESDIIVEAFKNSLSMYGLIYGRLVGDGDSNVYKKIITASPYGPAFHIEKIECKNHLIRNYITKLSDIKSNTSLNIDSRKLLDTNIEKIRISVLSAIKHWIPNDNTITSKVGHLKEDILNTPHHVFGDHTNCQEYYCSPEKQKTKLENGEINNIPKFQKCGIYDEIMRSTQRIANNAWSLLHNLNTNTAECYNSLVAKFVGAKRINFSQKGSYETRCHAAAVSFNNPANYHKLIQRQIGNVPGHYTEDYCKKAMKRKIQTKKRISVYKKKRIRCAGPDFNYGLNIDDNPDMERDSYEKLKNTFLKNLYSVDIAEVERNTRDQSLSELWIRERKIRLTASNFGRIFSMKQKTSTSKAVEEMLYSIFSGNVHTRYGQENENKAIELFEKTISIKTKAIGLCICKDAPFLAATPDRILENESAIIEVKCPASCKNLTPEEGVKLKKIKFCTLENGLLKLKENHKYMLQIQGQMHITNKDSCYFVIYTPKGINVENIRKNQECIQKLLPKLEDFYMNALLPEILDSRRTRNLPLRDYYLKKTY